MILRQRQHGVPIRDEIYGIMACHIPIHITIRSDIMFSGHSGVGGVQLASAVHVVARHSAI